MNVPEAEGMLQLLAHVICLLPKLLETGRVHPNICVCIYVYKFILVLYFIQLVLLSIHKDQEYVEPFTVENSG